MPNEDNRIYLEFPASEVKIELGETITFDNVSGFLDSGRVLYNDVSLTDELTHLENDKADADNVYSKTEIDNALDLKADKADTYTKTEIDSSLDLKADKSNTYTKSEVDTLIPTKTSELRNDSGFTSIDDTQTANDKTWSSEKIANSIPDVSNYYNKEETDALLENKADKSELYNVYPTDEESGAIAHITDGADNIPVKSLVSEIVAQQAEGTPTPANPKPITVYNSLNLSHSGADTSNPTVYNIPFGRTVAKGTHDVLSGVLTVTHFAFKGTGLNLVKTGTSGNLSTFQINFATNGFPTATVNSAFSSHFSRSIASGSGRMAQNADNMFLIIDNTLLSEDTTVGFVNWLIANDVTFYYECATPQVIQLSATEVKTLLGENNIYSDTGDVDVNYHADIGLYIDKKISSLAQG